MKHSGCLGTFCFAICASFSDHGLFRLLALCDRVTVTWCLLVSKKPRCFCNSALVGLKVALKKFVAIIQILGCDSFLRPYFFIIYLIKKSVPTHFYSCFYFCGHLPDLPSLNHSCPMFLAEVQSSLVDGLSANGSQPSVSIFLGMFPRPSYSRKLALRAELVRAANHLLSSKPVASSRIRLGSPLESQLNCFVACCQCFQVEIRGLYFYYLIGCSPQPCFLWESIRQP